MARVPLATYRLQFNKDFRFADALGLLEYLGELGISDIYASPVLSSRRGSPHGYDATDPTHIDPDLGSEEDFAQLQREMEARGMGLIFDLVPNHMAASSENPWWMDVLENGPASPFAPYFDIDWHPPSRKLANKILLPLLGKPFGEVLDSGELRLVRHQDRMYISYFESLFPLAAHSYGRVLSHRAPALLRELAGNSPASDEFEGILAGFSSLFESSMTSPSLESSGERRLKFGALRDRLRTLLGSEPHIAAFVDSMIAEFCGSPDDPASFSLLDRLLAEQHYKLAFWQSTTETINYRRFFTITDLVGVRVEDPLVFEATHGYLLNVLARNARAGLRIDHIDGLRDPLSYLNKLEERLRARGANPEQAPGGTPPEGRTFLVVEKILEGSERLAPDWPVSGTTGYDYLNFSNGTFVNSGNGPALERLYTAFIGRPAEWVDVLYGKKKLVASTLLNAEMRALGRALAELAAEDRYAREIAHSELTEALVEVTISLPVYRTYTRNLEISDQARNFIREALIAARQRRPQLNTQALDFVGDVLLLANPPHVFPEQREARLAFVMRWQQFTGPVVAKGLEDTALYVYFPLLSLNEVGGDPRPSRAASQEQFHAYIQERLKQWPHSLNATTTHDTKRSEDARMRINALSDVPDVWATRIREWAEANMRHKTDVQGELVPDRNEEYLLYQTLVGVCPPGGLDSGDRDGLVGRVQAYAVKATREAMVHTRWTRPNQAHEEAFTAFVARILDPSNTPFVESFAAFHREIARVAAQNSLAQTLLKVASPGVPDFYQGSELWELRLVDPDNRTPVDFAARRGFLSDLSSNFSAPSRQQICSLLANWENGKVKLYVVWKGLATRVAHRELFESGEYLPLSVIGPRAREVFAFARTDRKSWAVLILRRSAPFDSSTAAGWDATFVGLPKGAPAAWKNVLENRELRRDGRFSVAEALKLFPANLFIATNQAGT
jgi:(1->4)-alpha-D-glucan 1-alpha-D-glucosylmutase